MTVLNIKNLSLRYGPNYAFKDLSFIVNKRSVAVIIGPSGCGKSSLLNCINRMTDYEESCKVEGAIEVDGVDILQGITDTTMLRKKIGMIFQTPNPFPMSIKRNLSLPLRYHGIRTKSEQNDIIEYCLSEAGMWNEVKDRLDSSALSLSGGQQQRLCIARAIALQPEILLMDEPCSALDPVASQRVEQLILKLKKKFTVLVVTHNLAQARRISDQTMIMWTKGGSGYIADDGATDRVFANPGNSVAAAYISGELG